MSSFDWESFGEEVVNIVENAVKSQNFTKLNQNIRYSVNQAVKRGSEKIKRNMDSCAEKLPVKAPSKLGAVLGMLLGYPLGICSILYCIGYIAAFFLVGSDSMLRVICIVSALFFGGLSALGGWLAVRGTKAVSRGKRFKAYLETIGKREYCNILELSEKVGKSVNVVIKDVEYMIKKRWFLQGHLDSKKTCLMLTDKMYQQYCQLEKQKVYMQEEEQRKEAERKAQQQKEAEEKAQQTEAKGLSPEIQKVIAQGETYIRKIRACNDAIPGEMISAKIDRIELLVRKIFQRVEENPKCVGDIRKLMEYYLPTTVKLLEAYEQMDAQPAGGVNIQSAKAEIENTLDTLNVAFEKLLDDLFQETAWDVSSDISVLNTMLAQEGLKEDGLKIK